jgi:hypothetical protein
MVTSRDDMVRVLEGHLEITEMYNRHPDEDLEEILERYAIEKGILCK